MTSYFILLCNLPTNKDISEPTKNNKATLTTLIFPLLFVSFWIFLYPQIFRFLDSSLASSIIFFSLITLIQVLVIIKSKNIIEKYNSALIKYTPIILGSVTAQFLVGSTLTFSVYAILLICFIGCFYLLVSATAILLPKKFCIMISLSSIQIIYLENEFKYIFEYVGFNSDLLWNARIISYGLILLLPYLLLYSKAINGPSSKAT